MEIEWKNFESCHYEQAVRDQIPVTVFLMNGFQLRGVIAKYDVLVIVLFADAGQNIIYKHSIFFHYPAEHIEIRTT